MPGAPPVLVILAAGLGQRFGGVKQLAPIGPRGETILDYSAAAAHGAGCGAIVIVVRSEIERSVADHLDGFWPAEVERELVCQDRHPLSLAAAAHGRVKPLGTAHAVLVAAERTDGPLVIINADDLYERHAFELLARHFATATSVPTGALVTFEVAKTLLGDRPVRRALCTATRDGWLESVEEGTVSAAGGQLHWAGADRQVPLSGTERVSMNCWGFPTGVVDALVDACTQFVSSPLVASDAEVLLPDVVRDLVAARPAVPFAALASPGRCLGLTYAEDVTAVTTLVDGPAWP